MSEAIFRVISGLGIVRIGQQLPAAFDHLGSDLRDPVHGGLDSHRPFDGNGILPGL